MATTIGRTIRVEREAAGFTQDALAAVLKCSKAQLSLMESGQRTVSRDWAERIERALGIEDGRIVAALNWEQTPADVRARVETGSKLADRLRRAAAAGESLDALYQSGELRDLVDHSSPNVVVEAPMLRRIPIINNVAAGYPTEFTDLDYPASIADDYLTSTEIADPYAFAARVVGDSMEPVYGEGDVVIFSPELPTPNGCDCFIRLERDNETTFKRVYFEDDGASIRLQPLNDRYASRTVDRETITGLYKAAYVMRRVEQ